MSELKWVEASPKIEGNTMLGQKFDQRHCSEVQESPMVPLPLKITIVITIFSSVFTGVQNVSTECRTWAQSNFSWRVLAGHHFAGVNMMALRYRLTFIDVEMELPGGAEKRSKLLDGVGRKEVSGAIFLWFVSEKPRFVKNLISPIDSKS